MDPRTVKHYREIRAEHPTMSTRQALLWARSRTRVDDIDWCQVPSPPSHREHWESVGWTTDDGTTVRVDITDDGWELCDATDPDARPVADRAAWNRRAGMARGPAWQQALADYRTDADRLKHDEWRSALIRVVVTLPNGAEGEKYLGGWEYLDSTTYTRLWSDVIETVISEEMVRTATENAVNAALPPQYRRAS